MAGLSTGWDNEETGGCESGQGRSGDWEQDTDERVDLAVRWLGWGGSEDLWWADGEWQETETEKKQTNRAETWKVTVGMVGPEEGTRAQEEKEATDGSVLIKDRKAWWEINFISCQPLLDNYMKNS